MFETFDNFSAHLQTDCWIFCHVCVRQVFIWPCNESIPFFFSECRPGFYKWLLGNTPCYPCPANSYTNAPKSVECNCADGYFRNPRDSKNSSCTRKCNASNFLLLKYIYLNPVSPPSPPQHTYTHVPLFYHQHSIGIHLVLEARV